jgi:hypothetical protein
MNVPVRSVCAGQICSFSVNLGKYYEITLKLFKGKFAENWMKKMVGQQRKGLVLVDERLEPKAAR